MKKTIRAAVVRPDDSIEFVEIGRDSLEDRQKLVGGDIEGVMVSWEPPVNGYLSANGKYNGAGYNRLATLVLADCISSDDYIAGPLLLVGPYTRTGNDTDLPKRMEAKLKLLSQTSQGEPSN
jgi:hypothetical protein